MARLNRSKASSGDTTWDPLARLSAEQREKMAAYEALLLDVNQKINLISRESEAHFEAWHLLHCLSLTVKPFPAGSVLVDWGTGGGLPAIPLAICFPDVTVHAVDSVHKKIRAVRTMARRLELDNVYPWHGRAEQWPGSTHYSVSRATAPLIELWRWHARVSDLEPPREEGMWPPGLRCLKGGDLTQEIDALKQDYPTLSVALHDLHPLLGRAHFAEKYIVEVCEEDAKESAR